MLFIPCLPMWPCAQVVVKFLKDVTKHSEHIPAFSLSILLRCCAPLFSVWFCPLSFTSPVSTQLCVLQATYYHYVLCVVVFFFAVMLPKQSQAAFIMFIMLGTFKLMMLHLVILPQDCLQCKHHIFSVFHVCIPSQWI